MASDGETTSPNGWSSTSGGRPCTAWRPEPNLRRARRLRPAFCRPVLRASSVLPSQSHELARVGRPSITQTPQVDLPSYNLALHRTGHRRQQAWIALEQDIQQLIGATAVAAAVPRLLPGGARSSIFKLATINVHDSYASPRITASARWTASMLS